MFAARDSRLKRQCELRSPYVGERGFPGQRCKNRYERTCSLLLAVWKATTVVSRRDTSNGFEGSRSAWTPPFSISFGSRGERVRDKSTKIEGTVSLPLGLLHNPLHHLSSNNPSRLESSRGVEKPAARAAVCCTIFSLSEDLVSWRVLINEEIRE